MKLPYLKNTISEFENCAEKTAIKEIAKCEF